jgi:tyrosine-protein kinase Etk/Wzc
MNEKKDVDILDLLAALIEGKGLIIGGTLLICILTAGISLIMTEEFESTTQLLPPKEQKKGFAFADILSDLPIPSLRLGDKGTPADIFIAILKSPSVRRRMVADFDLMKLYEKEKISDAIERLRVKTEVGKSEQGTILITVLDRSPDRAAKMANAYVDMLDSINQNLARTAALERLDFIGDLVESQGVKLEENMVALQEFQEDHNAISIKDQAKAVIAASAEMQVAATELLISKLTLLKSGFSTTHPQVQKLAYQFDLRQEALAFLRDGDSKPDGGVHSEFDLRLDENLFLPLREIPRVAQEHANVEKDVLVQAALMKLLLQQQAESLIEASNTTRTVQILDPAMPAEDAARPRRLLLVFVAGILSLFASVFYTLAAVYVQSLRETWRSRYSDRYAKQ